MLSRSLGAAAVAAVVALLPGSAIATQNNVPTFTKDVAPIFQAKCEACHRVNSIAPMSLVTYEESRPWARSIRDRVSTRQMPPWHIDRTVGITDFRNDRSLTDAELDTIVRWVDGGAPRGNPEDMPAPVEWPDASKWYFAERFGGPPDLVVKSEPYTMPAEANDAWWKPVTETGLTEPRWVRAIELRPATTAGRRMTHHAIALSHVGDFNFNWHNAYVYADGAAPLLPRGTILKLTAWHDNTAANRANPDPDVWVGYGDRTVDEMAHAWVNVTYFTDEDYEAEVAARDANDN